MRYKAAVTDYVFENLEPEKKILGEIGCRVVAGQCKTEDEVIKLSKDADAILNTYFKPISRRVINNLKKCRIIVRYGIGVDTIDISAATEKGIMVANVPDYCLDEVSDHTLTLLLNASRKIIKADKDVRNGNWSLNLLKPIRRLKGQVAGIIGFGHIGRMVAKKAMVFGLNIVFFDPNITESVKEDDLIADKVEFNHLLDMSDFILIHAPATKETYHLIGIKQFRQMKKKPYLINTARGELIDIDSLIIALREGMISGAALDVIEGVPPLKKNHPLLNFDNVILTPHSAWYSIDALKNLQRLAAEEVKRVLKGEYPKSLINSEVKNKIGRRSYGIKNKTIY